MSKNNNTGLRIWIPIGLLTSLLVISAGYVYDFFKNNLPWTFYPGFLIGVTFVGIPFCWQLIKIWDPVTLSMRESYQEDNQKSNRWMLGPPLGMLTANIIVQLFEREVSIFIGGVTLGWLYAFLGFMAFQVWWKRPR